MGSKLNSERLQAQFEKYLGKVFLKNMTLVLAVGAVILAYYMYSDWSVRNSFIGVAIRAIPMVIILSLLLIHHWYRHQFFLLKKYLYISIYITLQLMMYAKCLLHLHEEALAPSVTGAILIIFLISLDIKENWRLTAFIYAFPLIVFTLLLIFIGKPSEKELLIIADIYPISIIGFIINRVHYKLRFRLFKSNKLLLNEQKKTKALYAESLSNNTKLEQQAIEARLIKEEIEEKNEELRKLNASKDKFLGIIAHDLKNPIGNICGLSDLLLIDKTLNGKDKQKCVELINENILHTHRLLENLLDWARAQSNVIRFSPAFHHANEMVEKELEALRNLAGKKSISIENNIPADLQIFTDQNMFETIIRNLVSNAIKFTYVNGEIRVDARLVQKENKGFTELSVADNGVGMEPYKLSKLFKISENISTSGTSNEVGTGLGLLLCKEFMDIHYGQIHVTSKPGEGSIFTCLFPLN
ncbi:signal transduction histidine kinase [Marinilabilia salmonicolor]|jgi:signal transduction histidine kinase|uniref:sensor histidine kinase n=1 Tax=Marinilabilia salmonicolor TaxID=989 RepID=UPI000D0551B9|nr:HAMP domain-containing sensor histidine kinase [Marinilabilia salmonicolor]PRY98222.1 signal transduction histidine kinase [Marinilabilia salmonicolor]